MYPRQTITYETKLEQKEGQKSSMDSYRPHQQQYMRPPPPPPPATSDPYHYQQQQQPPPPPRPPLPQQGAWYSNPNPNPNQYQYHSLQSPSPPPPQQQWGPPPHAEHLPPPPGSYAPPPPAPYYHPQSRPHGPPPPPPPLPPQSYHPQQLNQDWGAQSRQGWDYPMHNNEQDWAAKARAWAARTAMENQDQQPQFTPAGRPEEQTHYHEQYPQNQHQSLSASSYQQVPVSGTPTHRPPGMHPQDTNFIGSEPSPYGHHTVRSAIPSVHQQEVPSSYSSVPGHDASAEVNEHSYNLLPMPNSSGQEGQPHMQQAIPFGYGSHSADPATNPADQPLEFASGFSSDHGAHASSYPYHDSVGSIRGVDPATAVPSMNSWTVSVAPGVVYPPTLPVPPSGPQHDPSMSIPSPVPGNAPHSFGSFPGLSLQPSIPTTGPPFVLTAGTAGHPTVAFPGDAYGVSMISERPKKASVPNWLREEIKKVSITSSTMDHLKEETQSVEYEGVDRSFGKGDQADSKSIDSSRSTEEEDDEDEVEAARTAAINKEIKRILTEVLSTVTDELFDEIATKVLSEDDQTSEAGQGRLASNHKVLPSSTVVSTGKASAKLVIPAKTRDSETEDVSEKSSSSTPGDILGLANYATDDDDDDDDGGGEIPSSGEPKSGKDQFTVRNPHESHDATTNGNSPVELEERRRSQTSLPNDLSKSDTSYNKNKSGVSNVEPELPVENVNVKKIAKDDPQSRESRMKPDKHDQHDSKRSSLKENKEIESGKIRTDKKGDENRRRHDERPLRKERTDDRNGSKERIKDQNVKSGDKSKESDSRKRSSHADVQEDKRETDRLHRDSSKEDVSRKRERIDNKEDDRSRRKYSTDSSRHKRRHSSSIDRKDNTVNHANHSSDESSEDSKRKLHSRRRHSSPSPVRSRRRQVSRSPHSKHSQRRHSPYSSLDSNRGKGSRSRSPVRRHR